MKKNVFYVLTLICLLIVLSYLQYGRQPIMNHSTINQNDDEYHLVLSVTFNKIHIFNKTSAQKQLITYIENNTFPGVLFSYDIQGKPQRISCTVYANSWTRKLGIPAFQFNYSPN